MSQIRVRVNRAVHVSAMYARAIGMTWRRVHMMGLGDKGMCLGMEGKMMRVCLRMAVVVGV